MSDKKTPTCPCCGAKFAHDAQAQACKVCGLPDEVLAAGHRAVARWKRKNGPSRVRPANNRPRRAHGRPKGRR